MSTPSSSACNCIISDGVTTPLPASIGNSGSNNDVSGEPVESLTGAMETNLSKPRHGNDRKKEATSVATATKRMVFPKTLIKAPNAPKRFKSAFIFFSVEKHKEIRAQLGDRAGSERTANISKVVANAWKDLSVEEREKWESIARDDRTRYEVEKEMYQGPWQVTKQRKKKDPSAPKRPMSAFLAFANSERGIAKKEMPNVRNGEVSKILASRWKNATQEFRQPYIDEEKRKRKEYNTATAQWREIKKEKERVEKQRRDEKVRQKIEELKNGHSVDDYGTGKSSGNDNCSRSHPFPPSEILNSNLAYYCGVHSDAKTMDDHKQFPFRGDIHSSSHTQTHNMGNQCVDGDMGYHQPFHPSSAHHHGVGVESQYPVPPDSAAGIQHPYATIESCYSHLTTPFPPIARYQNYGLSYPSGAHTPYQVGQAYHDWRHYYYGDATATQPYYDNRYQYGHHDGGTLDLNR